MGGRALGGVVVVLVLVLASCSESGLLTPAPDQSRQVTVASVASGTMVSSGDQIPLTVKLNSSQSTPTDLKVELLSTSGDVVQTADIKNVDFSAPLPSIELSQLKSGSYTMRLTLYGADQQTLAQDEVNIFYVQGAYSLDGIASYPPTLPPNGSGLIVARVTAPEGANPYLRWSMGDKLIANGYLADGYDKIQWNAPSSTGVYSIMVEMFPYGPPPGGSFDFTSPYKMKVEVFVTSSVKSGRNELGPKESYYALYHFQGDLKDSVSSSEGMDALPVGNPTLSVNGSVFGYQLDGSSGFKVNSLLLPVDDQGSLLPASITMRVRLDKEQPNRRFFQTATSDGSFTFDMATDANGLLSLSVDGTPESNGVEIPSGDVASVTLSIIPGHGSLELLWFVNGKLSLSDSLAVDPKIGSDTGVSTIGGTDGFSGLIDEFGIYYKDSKGRDATDPEVYRRAMTDEYSSNLVFAEGFDGMYLPQDLTYTGKVEQDQLSAGLLLLKPEQSVTLPTVTVGEDDLTLLASLFQLSDTGQGTLSLTEKDNQLYSVSLQDAVNKSGEVELKLSKVEGGLKITAGSQDATTISGDISDVNVVVTSNGTTAIALRSFLIVKSQAQLAKKKATNPTHSMPET